MPKSQNPWIRIVTRRIGAAAVGAIKHEEEAMTEVCTKFPQEDWELKAVNFMGMEPNAVDVMFVFVATRQGKS